MKNANHLYIVHFSHRHGDDVWPMFAPEMPTEEQIIEELEDTWEGRDDESIEITGPFDNPHAEALERVVDSYDDTGCEFSGVIDQEVYNEARRVLGLAVDEGGEE